MNSGGAPTSHLGAAHSNRPYRLAKEAFRFVAWPFLHRISQIAIVLVVAFAGAGLSSAPANSGASAVCEVHHKAMRVEHIRARGGSLPRAPGYEATRSKLFPHAFPEGWPDPRPWKFKRVYICDDCARAQKEWLRKQQLAHSSLKSPLPHSHFKG
jgi:hypothetical protein